MTTDELNKQVNRFIRDNVWYNISKELYCDRPSSLQRPFMLSSRENDIEQLGRRLHTTISWNLYQYDFNQTKSS
jgi:hypothetical protein